MKPQTLMRKTSFAAVLFFAACSSYAADGFKLRFPISGTLGGEIIAPLPDEGWITSLAVTDIHVNQVTGEDGGAVQVPKTIGPVSALVGIKVNSYHATLNNFTLAHILSRDVQGGRLVAAINIPYASTFDTDLALSATVGGMTVPLAQQSKDASVSTSGVGDVETSLLWEKSYEQTKLLAGATLSLPTGNYKYVPNAMTPNIGYGNYYTLRMGLGVAYTASETLTLGARGSLGFNSQNTDNYVRSGDFYAIDLAAAFRTPVGVVGPHITMLRQYTDDTGANSIGPNRVAITGAGFFYTVPLRAVGGGLNLAYMKTTDTKNSLAGDFVQIRFSKLF